MKLIVVDHPKTASQWLGAILVAPVFLVLIVFAVALEIVTQGIEFWMGEKIK